MRALLCCEIAACLLAVGSASAQVDSAQARTGFDMSRYLGNKGGFLPVPIVITEPAIGYGGGLALVFFSKPTETQTDHGTELSTPSITGAGGFYTSSGAYGAGLAAYRPLHDDAIRYLGILGATSLVLHFYGFNPSGPLAADPLRYDFKAYGTLQRAQFRYRDTPWYGGVHYLFIDTKSNFVSKAIPADVSSRDLKSRLGGAGLSLEYDTRDNFIDARRGQDLNANVTFYGPVLGGTTSFEKLRLAALLYAQPRERWGVGGRVDVRTAWGDVPFYDKPYISMRGITAQQFSNNVAELQEVEAHYDVATRWTVLGFGGVGFTAKSWSDLGSASAEGAGGVGFRYLLAERLHLRSGIDLAVGPGGSVAVYVQNGAAWR